MPAQSFDVQLYGLPTQAAPLGSLQVQVILFTELSAVPLSDICGRNGVLAVESEVGALLKVMARLDIVGVLAEEVGICNLHTES